MTLVMYDSIFANTLPPGGDAYLGYPDGQWPTINGYTDTNGVHQPPLRQLFPGKPIISLTVTGNTLNADGCDIEPGNFGCPPNPTAAQISALVAKGAQWLKNKLATKPKLPPVAYCSVDLMGAVVSQLARIGVPRSSVLLLSAHYGQGEHICGPSSCNLIDLPQDGTQWTDTAPGVGAQVDRSLLADHFFTTPTTAKGNKMMIIWAISGKAYLLSGGRIHEIKDTAFIPYYAAAGALVAGSQGNAVVDGGEEAALLADFPPGQPVVTVPPVTVPPVTLTIPPLNFSGTVKP